MRSVREESGKCSESVQGVPEKCVGSAMKMCGKCLGDVWGVREKCRGKLFWKCIIETKHLQKYFRKTCFKARLAKSSEAWFRSTDLWVMRPTC